MLKRLMRKLKVRKLSTKALAIELMPHQKSSHLAMSA
ncbi:hypothetical protein SAMN05421543_10529 [Alicyclobacillus macrosporangiidus]|uniref:Uncharacterized protein n=1 Tax=Alicyclobacillus macrosporangiidus TaxID=392015 RepID=A0A1I7HPG2_9BACL|nr:hypothetical protein SAMN05421543_10529 [Alicyclobacillus macrosporangiidus]